ncbi:MAG: hypothetical protein F6K22_12035 [Okeania sp. SIO2F4]|uniref:sensor histidine kinase n=1 Tax=Okeania sp. SIO2F4 TaxID=2607790 RepID=UPI00142A5CDF|nr:hypothetical protein [Okeania sp. SIO2F4]
MRTFGIKAYLEEVLTSLMPNIGQQGHQVNIEGDENLNITTYPGELAQIVTNLTNNSLVHAYPDGQSGQLNWRIELVGETLIIEYTDDGCGITEAELCQNLSRSLRTFSRTDTANKTEFNLHDGIESTLLILKYRLKGNEYRPAIEIIKEYGNIPPVKCYVGQLNQVFMNILANGIDALDESNGGKTFKEIEKEPNRITIGTELSEDNKQVIVTIADNGTGMLEEVKARVFEQGFTTKGVGKGTGLGMAIAHQIVTEKHGGQITCNSKVGQGTIFTIVIPR